MEQPNLKAKVQPVILRVICSALKARHFSGSYRQDGLSIRPFNLCQVISKIYLNTGSCSRNSRDSSHRTGSDPRCSRCGLFDGGGCMQPGGIQTYGAGGTESSGCGAMPQRVVWTQLESWITYTRGRNCKMIVWKWDSLSTQVFMLFPNGHLIFQHFYSHCGAKDWLSGRSVSRARPFDIEFSVIFVTKQVAAVWDGPVQTHDSWPSTMFWKDHGFLESSESKPLVDLSYPFACPWTWSTR